MYMCETLLEKAKMPVYKRIFEFADIKQRSKEWYYLRKITASKILECVEDTTFAKFILEQSNENKPAIANEHVTHGRNLEFLS